MRRRYKVTTSLIGWAQNLESALLYVCCGCGYDAGHTIYTCFQPVFSIPQILNYDGKVVCATIPRFYSSRIELMTAKPSVAR